ncbi:FHA domain-containing protein [Spirosoma sp. KUDC1026]|uniref:FHA domain-containing protein n=1 Tax=Spirosoma sp. KUDC1026 TaxID=2745947 RepID=UPI00159BE904|nr:FHA domain-containing protein [Spirosoma sp. KUDC1026]QKZ15101.1 FHA domain-containing protein [Spirosoma sp. KUDC1026]
MGILDKLKEAFGFTPADASRDQKIAEPTPTAETSSTKRPSVETRSEETRSEETRSEQSKEKLSPNPGPSSPGPSSLGPPPAALRRDAVLRFVVEKLRPYQNESATAVIGLRLFVAYQSPEEADEYSVALWENQPGRFQQELNRLLLDNYITLPSNWSLTCTLVAGVLPPATYQQTNLGLTIVRDDTPADGPAPVARLKAVKGQLAQEEYRLDPAEKSSFCIGRGRTTETTSGRVRTNDIVILNPDDPGFNPERGGTNGAVSRAHATIRYDAAKRRYVLLVDPGGLPASGNKTKLFHANDQMERADIAGLSYPLLDGDQIELGGAVSLLFSLD